MYSSSDLKYKSDHEIDIPKDLAYVMLKEEDSLVTSYVI